MHGQCTNQKQSQIFRRLPIFKIIFFLFRTSKTKFSINVDVCFERRSNFNLEHVYVVDIELCNITCDKYDNSLK